MAAEPYIAEFGFIKTKINKLELADALLQLKKIANGKGETASKANQLIGNLLYNTSILGYLKKYLLWILIILMVENIILEVTTRKHKKS